MKKGKELRIGGKDQKYRSNYDEIDWPSTRKKEKNNQNYSSNYDAIDWSSTRVKKKNLPNVLGSIESTAEDILSGLVIYEASKSLSIRHITDDVRLINCYEHCNYSDLYSFLKLGEKRFKIRNYGKGSEEKLKRAITNHLESHGLEGLSVTAVNREKNYLNILEQLQRGKSAKKLINERDWDYIRKVVKDKFKESQSYPILMAATKLGMYWPMGKGPLVNKTICDYIDHSISTLYAKPKLGERKINTYIACVIYLYENQELVSSDDIDEAIESIWNSSNLSKKEQRIISLRYGIQEERKHTLEEIAHSYKVTRERVRQILKRAFKKIYLNSDFYNLPATLSAQKEEIWNLLTIEDKLKKVDWMEPLEDCLGFNLQLAIQIVNRKRMRSINTSSLYLWLAENFPHDESFWYRNHSVMSGDSVHKLHVNSDLDAFLNEI